MNTSRLFRYAGFVIVSIAPGMVSGAFARTQNIPAGLITSAIHDKHSLGPVANVPKLPERNLRRTLPKPLYYASGAAFATSVNWLGLKMERSPRWHKICWLPQAISIAGNLGGFAYTRSNSIVTQNSSTRAKTR